MRQDYPSYLDLIASGFSNDPQVIDAKEILIKAYQRHQASLCEIKPPISALASNYQQIIEQFNEKRAGKLFYPYIGSGMGHGPLVELMDGSVKYDFICGIGPNFFGHSNINIIKACLDAAFSDLVVQGNLQQNLDAIKLVDLLTQHSGLKHCFLTTSGAMAIENGLKIAFQKKHPASRIIAFEHNFCGRSLACAHITDKPTLRQNLPTTVNVDYIPYFDLKYPKESMQASLLALKKIIRRYPKEHALMVFELVQGEGGCYSGTREFFIALMDILKEHNIAILVDEIQTFGRTTELFAYDHFGLKDYVDICTIGKIALVCATLFKGEFAPRPGLLSQTFTSSSSAIGATIAIIEALVSNNLYGKEGKIARLHAYFEQKFKCIEKKYPHLIQGPFGIGALIAFTPYGGDSKKITALLHRLFSLGVIAFVAGESPMRVRLLPPMGVLTEADIDKAMLIIEKALVEGA